MTDLGQLKARLPRCSVLVVGDAMLDRYWLGHVDRISPEAPVPIVHVVEERDRLGGAANVALNVRSLGAGASLMTVVGDDEPARSLVGMLDDSGITALLGHDVTIKTTVKLRVSGRSQQLLRIDFESRPDHEILAIMLERFTNALPSHDAVLLSDYGKGGLLHISQMIELARAAGKPIFVDPKGSDYERYRGATVITPNRAELAQAIGPWRDEAELEDKAQAFRDRLDLRSLLLTRSEEGMSLFDDQGHARMQTEAREVFDITGAGDTVIATLAALVAAGLTIREASPIANRAAAFVVGKFGTATVSAEELFG